MKRVWTVGLLALLGRDLFAQRSARGTLAGRIDSLATAALAQWPAVGLSIAVVRGGDTVVMETATRVE